MTDNNLIMSQSYHIMNHYEKLAQSLKAYSVLYLFICERKFAPIHTVEVRMQQRHLRRDSPSRVQSYEAIQKVYFDVLEAMCMLRHRNTFEFRERLFHIRQL